MTPQDSVCSNEWYLDVESWSRVEELEAKINNTASYVVDILKWKQHIQELQSNIKEDERKKSEINGVNLAKMDEEAKIGLRHFDNVINLDMEIEDLTSVAQLTNIRIA